jgi:hypothetical protein
MDDLELEIAPSRAKKQNLLDDLDLGELTPLRLMGFVSAAEAAVIRRQSERAVRRKFEGEWQELGPRRVGVRLHRVLELPAPKLPK